MCTCLFFANVFTRHRTFLSDFSLFFFFSWTHTKYLFQRAAVIFFIRILNSSDCQEIQSVPNHFNAIRTKLFHTIFSRQTDAIFFVHTITRDTITQEYLHD